MALKDSYCTISEAAKDLGGTRQTISRWIRQGKISGEKIGREMLIKKSDLRASQSKRVAYAAADKVMGLMNEEITKYCREKGYIADNEAIEVVGEGHVIIPTRKIDDRLMKLSRGDWEEINTRCRPKLAELLHDLTQSATSIFSQPKRRITSRKNIEGGNKDKK